MCIHAGGLGQALLAVCLGTIFLLTNVAGAQAQVQPRVTAAVDNTQRVTLTGNTHPLAQLQFDHGAVDDALPMNRILLLLQRSPDQKAALQTYLEQVQDKGSPNYHNWLTPQQFGALYGPADADIQAVTQWLTTQGFQVGKIYSGKTVIEFSGTAVQVRSAFATPIHTYEINNHLYTANANDPQIPAALAPVVAGIVSLNSFPRQSHARIVGQATKVPGKPGWQPLFTFPNPFGGSGSFYAVAPGDFATIYNSKPLIQATPSNDGAGQSIAIVGETNINVSDVQAFRSLFGLPGTFAPPNVILNGPDPGITSVAEEGEANLDTQWSGAVAPGATVNLVVSASTSTTPGIDLSAIYIIDYNLAGVMSESYGACEADLGAAGNAFYDSLWEQAGAQGITAIVSAGDNGSAGCDNFDVATMATHGLAVNGLASTPYNVAAGGTDFDQVNQWSTYWSATNVTSGADVIGTSALSYIPEIPWSQNCAQIGLTGCTNNPPNGSLNIVAGSGGPSSAYGKPSWQLGVAGMPSDNHRDLPDVSLFASSGFDGSGYIICQADAYANLPCSITTPGGVNVQIIGGTSAAAPAFAGVMALVNQSQKTSQNPTPRQGNANYVLYALAKKSGATCISSASEAPGCIFNDVTKGNSLLSTGLPGIGTNSVPCQGGNPNCSVSLSSETGVLVEPSSQTTEAWTVGVGYDLATGLGSVNIANLIAKWATVNTVPTATTLTLNPSTGIQHGSAENVAVNIAVKPNSGTATGDVSLIATFQGAGGATTQMGLAQYTLGANGNFTGTTQSLPGGTYTVAAHYAGDGTNAPSDSTPPVPITVSPEGSKTFPNLATFDINGNLTSFTATDATYGSGFAIFRVDVGDAVSSVSSSAGISSNCSKGLTTCPTGVVSLTSTGTSLGTADLALNIAGYAETAPLPPGNYSVTANYPGDASYNASIGSTSFTIAKAPTSVVAAVAGTPVQYGDSEQIVASLNTTSNGAAPTGTFQFLVDGNAVGSPVGVYEGNGYVPGGNPPNYAWADASSTTAFLAVGNHALSVQYSGDFNYAASTSAPATVNVTKAQPIFLVYGATPNQINLNQQATLIAQMSGSDSGVTPKGTMTFYDGSATLTGTITYAPIYSAGLSASMTYTPTAAGTHQISVSYSGDSNYSPATSGSATLTVIGPDFTLTPQPASVTVTAGNPATYTVAVTSIDGLTSNVSVSCSLPAAATTCSTSPSSVTPGSSTTITVATTKHQVLVPSTSSRPLPPALSVWPVSLFAAIAFLCVACSNEFFRRRRCAATAILAGMIIGTALFVVACGGGGGGGGSTGPPPTFGTQPGSYTVTITAATASATHTTTVSLTVQ